MTRLSFVPPRLPGYAGACRERTEGLAQMGAFRKAGVWLGLVEEEDDPTADGRFDDEFADEDDDYAAAARPRSLTRQRTTERDLRARGARTDDRAERRRLGERDLRLAEQARGDHLRGYADPGQGDHVRSHADPGRDPARTDHGRDGHGRLDSGRLDGGRLDGGRADHGRSEQARADRAEQARTDHTRGDRAEYGRSESARTERGSVRHLSRPGASGYTTQDNLALAPESQPQVHQRSATTTDEANCRITTLHPTSYNEARAIGEHFRDGFPVIMNLTEMDEPDAKRLVDFAAGLAFGLRGSMERVTNRVFLLSPPNIQVSAEDKARIAEGGFFQQP
jgi:cell division inhibitor SepF